MSAVENFSCAGGKSAPSFAITFHRTGTPLFKRRTRKSASFWVMLIKRSRYRVAVYSWTGSGSGCPFTNSMKPNGAYFPALNRNCLLYTSDAADERSSVDLGGRRIIKKK